MSSFIWLECQVPQGSVGELPSAPYASRLLGRMGFDRMHPMFFSVQEGVARSSAICRHHITRSSPW
jgi:hypothetical protein